MNKSATLTVFVLLLFIGISVNSNAEVIMRKTTIVRTLVASTTGGGCMVKTEATFGPLCTTWVPFSCDGTFTSQAMAFQMFDSALMAFTEGRKVRIWVDDSKKHNGHCVGTRIDVMSASQ